MRTGKNKIIAIISAVLATVIIITYVMMVIKVNAKIVTPEDTIYNIGEEWVVSGVTCNVKAAKWYSKEEIEDKYPTFDTGFAEADYKVVMLTIEAANNTDEEKTCALNEYNLETEGISNGISNLLTQCMPDSGLGMYLEPGEKKTAVVPYVFFDFWFNSNEWKSVEDREFRLVTNLYPDKVYVKVF